MLPYFKDVCLRDVLLCKFSLILKDFACKAPLSLGYEVHLSDVLIGFVDEAVSFIRLELARLEAETYIVEEIRIHRFSIVKEVTERAMMLKHILVQVILHQLSLDVSWQ